MLATWTYGLYVPSGLFVPVILCGAAMGRLFGECVHLAFPNGTWSSPGMYALIGAASLLGKSLMFLFPSLKCIQVSKLTRFDCIKARSFIVDVIQLWMTGSNAGVILTILSKFSYCW